jgi:small-conductance mechanosensitive channel
MSNFIAGLILLIAHPLRLGDRVELGGRSGDVVQLGVRSSSIRTDDNILVVIPNSDFLSKPFLI